jgi:hypothetical protein
METFAWETEAGFAVHLLNYTNPNLHKGWIRQTYPVGEQKVQIDVPGGRKVTRVELLKAEKAVPFTQANGRVSFTVPSVDDYEIAGVYATST